MLKRIQIIWQISSLRKIRKMWIIFIGVYTKNISRRDKIIILKV